MATSVLWDLDNNCIGQVWVEVHGKRESISVNLGHEIDAMQQRTEVTAEVANRIRILCNDPDISKPLDEVVRDGLRGAVASVQRSLAPMMRVRSEEGS